MLASGITSVTRVCPLSSWSLSQPSSTWNLRHVDPDDVLAIRRTVIRRVRYAANTLALLENRVPPEGPYDAALTNGLVIIVSAEWPGEEIKSSTEHLRSARELLGIIEEKRGVSLPYVAVGTLRDGLELTQPFRHGRADDEFATIGPSHITALRALDQHRDLRILDQAAGHSVDDLLWLAFTERADECLPFDLKDRLEVPEPEPCDDCGRPTFLPDEWDAFGGTSSPGFCIACGYERSDEEAWDLAIDAAIERHADE
jgi:hypothetical protein